MGSLTAWGAVVPVLLAVDGSGGEVHLAFAILAGMVVLFLGAMGWVLRRSTLEHTRSLEQSEARYRTLVENMREGVNILDLKTRQYAFISPNQAVLTGFSEAELRAMKAEDAYERVHPDDRHLSVEQQQELESGKVAQNFSEYRWRVKSGEYRWFSDSRSLVRDASGTPLFLIGVSADITARKQAEAERAAALEALQKAKETEEARMAELELILHTALDGFWVLDRGATLLDVNPALCELLGYQREELVGRRVADLMPGETLRSTLRQARQVVLDGRGRSQARLKRKDGKLLEVEVSSRFLPAGGGRIVAFVRDITASLRAEEQLRQAQKMEAVGRLAGGVAHDFNNLLTVISLGSQLAMQGVEGQPALQGHLKDIRSAAERGKEVAAQLLAFSRQQVLDARTHDLNQVVREEVHLLKRLLGEHLEVVTELAEEALPVRVDAVRFQQVLLNLAVNAADAMPQGGTLTLRSERLEPPATCGTAGCLGATEPRVLLTVSDTGTGMDETTRRRAFEPFFTTKPAGKGTGLGLSIAFGLVQQMGGTIALESEPGVGTRFLICLPVAEAAAAARPRRPTPLPAPVPSGEAVLVLEDEEPVRRLISLVLGQQGLRVLTAGSLEEAREAVARNGRPPRLLLTDVRMPGLSGPEAALVLQRELPGLQLVFMSGYSSDEVPELAMVPQGAAFLQKPFTAETLLERVREALREPGAGLGAGVAASPG